jgi:hypothetical protein
MIWDMQPHVLIRSDPCVRLFPFRDGIECASSGHVTGRVFEIAARGHTTTSNSTLLLYRARHRVSRDEAHPDDDNASLSLWLADYCGYVALEHFDAFLRLPSASAFTTTSRGTHSQSFLGGLP